MRALYEFDGFRFQTAPYSLEHDGEVVPCMPQSYRLLELFVRHPGLVLTRDDIRETLWPEDVHVEFDRGITMAIRELRRVLGDDASAPRFIETHPRIGYQWIMPSVVEDLPYDPQASLGEPRPLGWIAAAFAVGSLLGVLWADRSPH